VPFGYFNRLSRPQQRIYLASDAVRAVPLPAAGAFAPIVARLADGLPAGERAAVERACQAFADELGRQLAVPPVTVRVLTARPSHSWGELHGLYEPAYTPPRITLWMRTAQRHQVVAFRTFLRTLLHELLHHLDYEWLRLRESFHTEGFYQRESSLLKQVLGELVG
jgi:hypothetical protein